MEKPIICMTKEELAGEIQFREQRAKYFELHVPMTSGRLANDLRVRAGTEWYRRNCAIQELQRRGAR